LTLCLGIFLLSSQTLWAETPAEMRLLDAAKAYFHNDIRPSEEKLFRNTANGLDAVILSRLSGKIDETLRADRVGWLCTNAQAISHVTNRGVVIVEARIQGSLNLSEARIGFPVSATRCAFEDSIDLSHATVLQLELDGSSIASLFTEGATVLRDLSLANGFESSGKVWIQFATIDGDLGLQWRIISRPEGGASLSRCEDQR
jgi:hypothetical protein